MSIPLLLSDGHARQVPCLTIGNELNRFIIAFLCYFCPADTRKTRYESSTWTSHLQNAHGLDPSLFFHVEVKYNGAQIRILFPLTGGCPIGGCTAQYPSRSAMSTHLRNNHSGPLPAALEKRLEEGELFWFRPRYDTKLGGPCSLRK